MKRTGNTGPEEVYLTMPTGNRSFLSDINDPGDLRKLKTSDLPQVCREVREHLIDTVSSVGGHFSSSLGVVELTVALHYVLNTPEDRIVWDTGHQTYPHKILTGRRDSLQTVRRLGGISGFPKRQESPYDTYNTGHAGTAISQMLGEALARDAQGKTYNTVAVIGDASIATGMAFEALNHGGHVKSDCLVILNDNDMSISRNVGALNQYLNSIITSPVYNNWKRLMYNLILWVPFIGPALHFFLRKVENSTKGFFTPGSLFTDFGFRYIGPVDGNEVEGLVDVLKKTIQMKGPILLHVLTQKGKGYKPAELNPTRFHSVSVFNRTDGSFLEKSLNRVGYSEIVGETLAEIIERDPHTAVITPAMIEGSGLSIIEKKYPQNLYDTGIAEQHAVSFAGAMATAGMKTYFCIYSTFITRAMSQVIQDIALINVPVRIIIDRAGCVGPDGETHQGLFDLGMILAVPGISVYAPAGGSDLRAILLHTESRDLQSAIAIRFPKGTTDRSALDPANLPDISSKRPVIYGTGRDLAIIAVGVMWDIALEAEAALREAGISCLVAGMRWIRPFDSDYLEQLLSKTDKFIIIEDSYINSGAASWILSNISPEYRGRHLRTFAFPDRFIEHGTREEILHKYDLSAEAVTDWILKHPDLAAKTRSHSVRSIS